MQGTYNLSERPVIMNLSEYSLRYFVLTSRMLV